MLKGVICPLGVVPMNEHLECMNKPDHPCMYTPDMLEIMTDRSGREGVTFSPTSLLGCPRQEVLQGNKDYYIDVDNAYAATRGTLIHEAFSKQMAWPGVIGTIREYRFSTPINTKYGEQTFKGKADLVVLRYIEDHELHIAVVDYKTKAEIKHDFTEVTTEHDYQVNMYAWLVQRELVNALNDWKILSYMSPKFIPDHLHLWMQKEHKSVVVDYVEIVYISMQKPRRFTSYSDLHGKGKQTKRSYPQEHEELVFDKIKLRRSSSIEKFVVARIEKILKDEGKVPGPLTGDRTYVCRYCPVRSDCIDLGEKQGYDMSAQRGVF